MKNLKQILCSAALALAAFTTNAQVKIGANPTTITPNTNLEIEATNGIKSVFSKDLGNVGIGTTNTTTLGNAAAYSARLNVLTAGNTSFIAKFVGTDTNPLFNRIQVEGTNGSMISLRDVTAKDYLEIINYDDQQSFSRITNFGQLGLLYSFIKPTTFFESNNLLLGTINGSIRPISTAAVRIGHDVGEASLVTDGNVGIGTTNTTTLGSTNAFPSRLNVLGEGDNTFIAKFVGTGSNANYNRVHIEGTNGSMLAISDVTANDSWDILSYDKNQVILRNTVLGQRGLLYTFKNPTTLSESNNLLLGAVNGAIVPISKAAVRIGYDAGEASLVTDGNVGIGTMTPLGMLNVAANGINNGLTLQGGDYNAGYGAMWVEGAGGTQKLYISAKHNFGSTTTDLTTITNSDIILNKDGGNVGIGTLSPAAALHVGGTGAIIVPVGTTAQAPAAAVQGMIRFNTTTNKFEGYDGTAWVALN
jgi:hypothetical protein